MMQVVDVCRGTFVVMGQPLAHRAALRDDKPGVYKLCKRGAQWELYYTATGASRPVKVSDRVAEAKQALLDWHTTNTNCNQCVERGGGAGWDLCPEAQELFAGS